MGGGELEAVFRALAEDTDEAAGNIASAIARFTGTTAETEDANVARTLAADAENARAIAAIGKHSGVLADGGLADEGWGGAESAETASGLAGLDSGLVSDGWAGAGHVEASSPEAEAAYAAIRGKAGDVAEIAENTGISQDIIAQVKNHLFLTEHDVPVGPGRVVHGYFTARQDIASLWNKAEEGTLDSSEQDDFRSLISHEYVESRLMESGMPYRSAAPEAWDDGAQMFNPQYFGAHEVATIAADGSLRQWPALGLTPPAASIAPDLSNLDVVVNAARKGLTL
jgi:hypothetical protein